MNNIIFHLNLKNNDIFIYILFYILLYNFNIILNIIKKIILLFK